jgi:hypothetical protein
MPLVTVTGGIFNYEGAPHAASATAKFNGVDVSGTFSFTYNGSTQAPVNAGSYAVVASFTSSDVNYKNAAGDGTISIIKANAVVVATGATVTYDGKEHAATGTATGVAGEDLTDLLDLGTKFTNVPGGTAIWTFAGNGNYNAQSGSVGIVIERADATVKVDGVTVTYDGKEHGATGTATGVDGEDLASLLDLGGKFPNVPGGMADWAFAGNGNYNAQSGSVTIVIEKATPAVSVTGGTYTYDGHSHPATATAAGVSGSVAGAFNFTYNGAVGEPVNAGTYSVIANFTSTDANYRNATGEGTITIEKANAVIVVSAGTHTYNGQAWGAQGTATSVTGQDLSSLLNLGEKFTNVPGGTATWKFLGDVNHNAMEGTVTIVISPAPQTITVTTPAPANALYNTTFTVSAMGGGSGNPVTYSAAGPCTVSGATFTMTSGYGQCTVTFRQLGNNNYLNAIPVVQTVNATPWQVVGFYAPVASSAPGSPIWNVVKGGSTVPLKFEIFAGVSGTEQTSLSAVGSMWLQAVNCTGGASLTVDPSQLEDTGGTALRYDGSQFIQNWKTTRTPGCFLVTMQAADSSTIRAYFQVR